MTTLREHRLALAANPDAWEADIPRLARTLVPHLKRCGFHRVGVRNGELVSTLVAALFDAQGRRPMFHIDAQLPFCWNAPKYWSCSYIRYEWGHLRSRNQNRDAEQIDNLMLSSARCNQHIQTSMDIDEVRDWLDGSRIAQRIDEVLAGRKRLFQSTRWGELCARLEQLR